MTQRDVWIRHLRQRLAPGGLYGEHRGPAVIAARHDLEFLLRELEAAETELERIRAELARRPLVREVLTQLDVEVVGNVLDGSPVSLVPDLLALWQGP